MAKQENSLRVQPNMAATEKLLNVLKQKKQTLGFAESCTGGKISARVTSISGASEVFWGSVVSYANQVKMNLISVSESSLHDEGAVSETVARQMAQGARKALNVDWALAVTGIAGPSGGTQTKPVGTVWFAVSGPGVDKTDHRLFSGDRAEIQEQSVNHAIELLLQLTVS